MDSEYKVNLDDLDSGSPEAVPLCHNHPHKGLRRPTQTALKQLGYLRYTLDDDEERVRELLKSPWINLDVLGMWLRQAHDERFALARNFPELTTDPRADSHPQYRKLVALDQTIRVYKIAIARLHDDGARSAGLIARVEDTEAPPARLPDELEPKVSIEENSASAPETVRPQCEQVDTFEGFKKTVLKHTGIIIYAPDIEALARTDSKTFREWKRGKYPLGSTPDNKIRNVLQMTPEAFVNHPRFMKRQAEKERNIKNRFHAS